MSALPVKSISDFNLLFPISSSYRGDIQIALKAINKIACNVLKTFEKDIKIHKVNSLRVDNFYLHFEFILELIRPNEVYINSLIKKIKKAINVNFIQQLDIKVYNIIILFQ